MVGRRRDQSDARRRVAHFRDPGVDLFAGQLSSFAWLGALCHLDLQLSGVDKIVTRHAEASRGHLLDGAVFRIAIRLKGIAGRIFAAFACIAAPADAVHRNRQGFMRLFADRAVGHRPGLETFADRLYRFHFFDGNTRRGRQNQTRAGRAGCTTPYSSGRCPACSP